MKIIILVCLLGILLMGCVPSITPPPAPVPTPAPIPTPIPPLPKSVEVPLTYKAEAFVRVDTDKVKGYLYVGDYPPLKEITHYYACVRITNTDTERGSFTVVFSVKKLAEGFTSLPWYYDLYRGQEGYFSLPRYLDLIQGETKEASCPADELGDWSYKVIPSTKTVTK